MVEMSDEIIDRVEGLLGTLNSLKEKLNTEGTELVSSIDSNGYYQYFKLGTEKGFGVDSDLKSMISILVNQVVPTIQRFSSTVSATCEAQRRYNQERREQLAREKMARLEQEQQSLAQEQTAQKVESLASNSQSTINRPRGISDLGILK